MYSRECPVEGCNVVLHDDDADRLIEHMKAHVKTHEAEDENKMKSAAANTPHDETAGDSEDEKECSTTVNISQPDPVNVTIDEEIIPTPNIATALCNMQKTDLGAITESDNPFFNTKYADLASVWAVIRKPLTDSGLSIMQYPEQFEGGITIITRLYHTSGEMFETRLSGKTDLDKGGKQTIQKLGSLITYLRRYSISMLVGVAPKDDDDGNAASGKEKTKATGGD